MSPSASVLFLSIFLLCCNAFTFSTTAPTECQPFTISWTGGTSPFTILLLPALDTPRNVSVPSTSTGSFTLQLPFKADGQFIVTMSDSTGFASGGISDILTVGRSLGQSSCNTATPNIPFFFDLPNPLVQCEPLNITWDNNAIMPVAITAVVPVGQFFHFSSGTTDHFFVWNQVNVQAGTNMLFFVTDNQGNFGGTSRILAVGNDDSGSSACLNSQSPHPTTTTGSGGSTQVNSSAKSSNVHSATPTTNNGTSANSDTHGSKPLNGAVIGGIAAGGVVALVAAGLAGYFFCFRNRSKNNKDNSNGTHQNYSYDYLKPAPYNGSASLLSTPTLQQGQFNAVPSTPETNQYHQVHPSVPQSRSYQSIQAQPLPSQQPYSSFGTTSPQPPHGSTYPAMPSIPGLVSPVPPSVLLAQRREASNNPPPQFVQGTPYLQPQRDPSLSTSTTKQSPAAPRIVVHTDADDIVELPPQYRDRPAGGSDMGSSTAVSDSSETFKH